MFWILGILVIVVVVGMIRYVRRGNLALHRDLRRLRAEEGRPGTAFASPVNEHNPAGHGLGGFGDGGGSAGF